LRPHLADIYAMRQLAETSDWQATLVVKKTEYIIGGIFALNRSTALTLSLLLSFAPLALTAGHEREDDSKNEPLRIGKEDSIAAAGVKLKIFKDMSQKPIPAVDAPMYRIDSKTGTHTLLYPMLRLWIAEQCVGYWSCDSVKIFVLKMKLPPPEKDLGMIPKEGFEAWIEQNKLKGDGSELNEWLDYLAGGKAGTPGAPVKNSSGIAVANYPVDPQGGSNSMERSSSGKNVSYKRYIYQASNGKDLNAVLLYEYIGSQAPNEKTDKAIAASANSIGLSQPKGGQDDAKQMVLSKSKVKKEWSETFIKSREDAIDSLKGLKDWWYLETDNFILISNLKRRGAISDIQDGLENARAVFTKQVPLMKPIDAVSVVRVFEKRDEYVDCVGKELTWSAGVWMPGKKELVISPMDWLQGQKKVEEMVRVVYHEGFHQYLHYATAQHENATWFNEGTAKFMECMKCRPGGKFSFELSDNIYNYLKEGMKKQSQSVQRLIGLDHYSFIEKSALEGNYLESHALMYYLYKGAPAIKGKEAYQQIPSKYYKAIIEKNDWKAATTVAWEGIDMNEFEKDFREFWESKALYNRSKDYEMKPLIDASELPQDQKPAEAKDKK